MSPRTHRLVARPAYLIGSSLVARLPDLTIGIPMVLLVLAATGSYAWAGLASGTLVAGAAAATPVLGRLADRLGYRPVLGVAAAASAGLLILIALTAPWLPAPVLVALAGAAGLASPPLEASVRAIVARTATGDARQRLLTVDATAQEVVFIVGPVLHVLVATLVSPRAAVGLAALVMAAGTGALLLAPLTRGRAPAPAGRRGSALASPAVRRLAFLALLAGAFFGLVNISLIARGDELGAPWLAGVFHALWAAGSLAGGTWVALHPSRRPVSQRLVLLLGLSALAAAPLAIGAGAAWSLGLLLVLQGVTVAPAIAVQAEAIAETAPAGLATEAFAWSTSLTAVGLAGGEAAGGMVVSAGGGQASLAVAVGVLAAAAAAAPLAARAVASPVPAVPRGAPATA
ncbi:MAG: MFS transporter [Thermoleophilia bacterium]|jgi:MFS family permease|nr:MFS transporter [Thermoleophilia bacterium]